MEKGTPSNRRVLALALALFTVGLVSLSACSFDGGDSEGSRATLVSETTTTEESAPSTSNAPTSSTTTAPAQGDRIWSESLVTATGSPIDQESVTSFDDAVLIEFEASGASSGGSQASAAPRWQVLDALTGEELGTVTGEPSDRSGLGDLPDAVLGTTADEDLVLATRRVVRVPGEGVKPGRTDQLLGLYEVATGKLLWEVDALLGDTPSSDPNSTSGTRPFTPVAVAGGNLIGYAQSGIPADAEQAQIKAVSLADGSLAWESPRQVVRSVGASGEAAWSTRPDDPEDDVPSTIEVRNASTGEITATKTFPVFESGSFSGGTNTRHSTINAVVELPDNTYVVDVTVPTEDAEGFQTSIQRVEMLDSALTTTWSKDGVTLMDSPGLGVVALSTDMYNNGGTGLQGVDVKTGESLWSISDDDLEATEFRLEASIDDTDDVGETRGLIFGTARDETTAGDAIGSNTGLVVIDARSGKQVYVQTAQSAEIDTVGYWLPGVFVAYDDEGNLAGFAAKDPPIGVSGTSLVFPTG